MRQGVDWLYGELPKLVEHGLLTPEAAEALRRHYGPAESAPRVRWGQILLACFGALLIGGGLILILAHNWDALSRPARAAVALGILLIGQGGTLFAVTRRPGSSAWIEPTSGFLVAAVGAAMALVGQTYHLGGSFEDLLVAWLALVVVVPYFTGSRLASIGFWALLVVRITALSWHDTAWDPWLFVLAGAPFAILLVRRNPESWGTTFVVLAAAASAFIVGSIAAAQTSWHGLWAVFQIALLSAILAASAWPPQAETDGSWRGRLSGPAWLALVVIAAALTFDTGWRPSSEIERQLRSPNVLGAALVALICTAYASALSVKLARAGRTAAAVSTAAAVLALVTHGLALNGFDVVTPLAFNLWLAAVGCLTLIEGVRAVRLGAANRGLFALAVLIACRFFDTDFSFLARGLAFVMLGISCLALNFWLMRRIRRQTL